MTPAELASLVRGQFAPIPYDECLVRTSFADHCLIAEAYREGLLIHSFHVKVAFMSPPARECLCRSANRLLDPPLSPEALLGLLRAMTPAQLDEVRKTIEGDPPVFLNPWEFH